MNKTKTKEDLENTLALIGKFKYDFVFARILADFTSRMEEENDIDEYLMYLANKMLEFSRKNDSNSEILMSAHKILRRIAHKIYRSYNDERKKEGFLTLV